MSPPSAPALGCHGDLKAQAGAAVGGQAELPDKSSLSEKKCPAAFAFTVVCDGKGSLAVKSSAVDPANGRFPFPWAALVRCSWLLLTFLCDPSPLREILHLSV